MFAFVFPQFVGMGDVRAFGDGFAFGHDVIDGGGYFIGGLFFSVWGYCWLA